METSEAYLERKHREIGLLNDCLRSPLHLARPQSVEEVVDSKFQLAAALRAEHALQDWKATETACSHAASPSSGPFVFSYDYQRADLKVCGPSFYELERGCRSEAIYTASGMAAISALLLASARTIGTAGVVVLPGTYGETVELIESLAPHLRLVTARPPLGEAFDAAAAPRLLLLDSRAPAGAFRAGLPGGGSGPLCAATVGGSTC